MPARSHHLRDLAFAGGLLLLLLLFFWPVTVGNQAALPADVLYQQQPWRSYAPPSGPPAPHNGLVMDLVVENYVWKQFIRECLQARQLPLWNPYILSGLPFLAAGQHSALYPFSLIYYIFPLSRAYGIFTVSQLLIAGLSLYFYARTIRLSRFAAAAGGLVFAFSGFFLVSTVHPMIIAVAVWLPFLLAISERLLQAVAAEAQTLRERLRAPLPWLILGSLALGCQFLAGHAEPSYYSLLVLGAYTIWRAASEFLPRRQWRPLLTFGGLAALMVILGVGLGAVQVLPFYELVNQSSRQGAVSYAQIIDWAYKPRQIITFLIPDLYGNPVQHSYVDLFSGQTVTAMHNARGESINTISWGMKNYVEAGAYLSILSLLLALLGALRRPRRQAWFFIVLALFSLSLAFGLPTYRLIYALPGINQLHTPFRWVFPYTVCMAILAAMGAESLAESALVGKRRTLPAIIGALALLAGLGTLAAIALAWAFPARILPLADRAVASLALAPQAFADGRMFLSYEARNLFIFALCLLGAGAVLLAVRFLRPARTLIRSPWPYVLLAILVLDPAAWLRSFQPAADPAPLNLRPVVVEFLKQQPEPFRITVFDTQSRKPLPANTNMLYGLQDVRGYDSIIPKQYAEVMLRLGDQELLDNQIARLTEAESLDSPILDLLNVRYVLTEEKIDRPHYTLVHEDALRVYRNEDALPRAFVTFQTEVYPDRERLLDALSQADLRRTVLLEAAPPPLEPLARPVGDVLFTVSGDVAAPNMGQVCAIDEANSAALLKDYALDDPFASGGQLYRGVLLSDLWKRCGTSRATVAVVTAADGQQITIPRADLLRWPILVVTQANRKQLAAEQGGPVKLAFPPELAAKYPASAWLQSIKTIEFAEPASEPPVAPPVEFVEYSPNQVRVHVDMPQPGYLVLTDNYFPGWVAYTTPEGMSEKDEQALTILRADGTVRAIPLPAGPQTVRLKYAPGSVKTGAFISFISGIFVFLLGAFWVWARIYSPTADEHAVRRVARNTIAPMALQLLNKGIDLVFAMLMLRLLGPENSGKYYFAILVAVWFEILTNFGLNTLLTREVARNRQEANRFLGNTTILRLGLAILSAPLLILFLLLWPKMSADTALAIGLLAIGLVPSSISAGLSAVFMAYEAMEIPAVVTTVTTVFKVTLGAAALLLGWGFIGLAGVSIIVNVITAAILFILLSRLFFRPRGESDRPLQKQMVLQAYPLMLNHLLATLFFKVDVALLQYMASDAVVGMYSVPYKLVDAFGIIPPTFTMAIFPLMSRLATESRAALRQAYILSIKLLFCVALLIAFVTTVLAYPLVGIIGGAAYLPHSAIALQIIIWYMPIGFINSVTQYVLIALDQQRFLTRAYAIGLACGLGANLILIPRYGYQAAAAVHVLAEIVLFIPFYIGVRRHLGPIPWAHIFWRPTAAAGVAGGLLWLLRTAPVLPVATLAVGVYLALLFAFGAFDAQDRAILRQVLPLERLRARLPWRRPVRTV